MAGCMQLELVGSLSSVTQCKVCHFGELWNRGGPLAYSGHFIFASQSIWSQESMLPVTHWLGTSRLHQISHQVVLDGPLPCFSHGGKSSANDLQAHRHTHMQTERQTGGSSHLTSDTLSNTNTHICRHTHTHTHTHAHTCRHRDTEGAHHMLHQTH